MVWGILQDSQALQAWMYNIVLNPYISISLGPGPVRLYVYWLYCNFLVRQHRQAHTRLQVELVLDKF